jgi:hypothetical protein
MILCTNIMCCGSCINIQDNIPVLPPSAGESLSVHENLRDFNYFRRTLNRKMLYLCHNQTDIMKRHLLFLLLALPAYSWACHGLVLVNVQVTTNTTHILITAESDAASCGCGPYYMQAEVSTSMTFTGVPPANNSPAWGSFPWYRSLLDIPGYSAPNWTDNCVPEPYDTIAIPASIFCPGSTIYLRLREYVEGSASPGPWVTYSAVVPGVPGPLSGFAFTTDSVVCGDSTVISVMHNSCSGNYTINWSPSASLSNPTGSSTSAFPTATTSYTVTFTDNSNSQTFTDVVTIYAYAGVSASATATVASCNSGMDAL